MTVLRGITTTLYALILVAAGALIWLFVSGPRDYYETSRKFDVALTDVLAAGGVSSADLVSAVQREQQHGRVRWLAYAKEIRLPASVDRRELLASIEAAAQRHRLDLRRMPATDGRMTVTVSAGKLVLSRLELLPPAPAGKPAPRRRLAIVIDDVGSARNLAKVTTLGVPVTCAILPHETYSGAIAAELAKKKIPFILHMPMEPDNYPKVNPGVGPVLVGMDDAVVRQRVTAALRTVPGAAGISNHMGSRFSADPLKMRSVMNVAAARGLFYFDSYTTPKSVAKRVARDAGVPYAENGLFLDLVDEPAALQRQCDAILKQFATHDTVIAIGHIHKKHLFEVLARNIPRFKQEGITFVYLPELARRQ